MSGFVTLIINICFLALCVLPFYLANILGRSIDARIKNVGFNRIFPILLLLVTAGWGWATYVVFKRDCELVTRPKFAQTKPQRPDGFSFYNNSNFRPAAGFRWEPARRFGFFKYIDHAQPKSGVKKGQMAEFDYAKNDDFDYQRSCAGKIISENPKTLEINGFGSCASFKDLPRAEMIVAILPERTSQYWWRPPIYELEIQAKDRSNGNVIASATDLVIGGGIVGTFLLFFGGDQDYEFLSCGYASSDIGPWRPSLTSRLRYVQYEEADTNFVIHSFSEN